MEVNFKCNGKNLIVIICGEIDHHTSEDVRDRIDNYLDSNIVKNIIFDLKNLDFMDSAGIGVIIGRYKKIAPFGGKVALVITKPQIKRIIEISGLLKIITIYDSLDNALINM